MVFDCPGFNRERDRYFYRFQGRVLCVVMFRFSDFNAQFSHGSCIGSEKHW